MGRCRAGESTRMARSGRCRRASDPTRRTSRHACPASRTAPTSMVARAVKSSTTRHPAACIAGPATPQNSVSGRCRRISWINSAACRSPLNSAAEMKMRNPRGSGTLPVELTGWKPVPQVSDVVRVTSGTLSPRIRASKTREAASGAHREAASGLLALFRAVRYHTGSCIARACRWRPSPRSG